MNRQFKKLALSVLGAASLVGCNFTQQRVRQLNIPKTYSQEDKHYKKLVETIDRQLKKENNPKKVDLEILVDAEYIKRCAIIGESWWEQLQHNVIKYSGERFKSQFGIEFEIDSVKYTKLDSASDDAHYLVTQIMLETDPGRFDAILAFTGRMADSISGVAIANGNHALVFAGLEEDLVTQHELSHLVNAIDISICDYNWWDDVVERWSHPIFFNESVMSYNHSARSDRWDETNILRINNAKNRSWEYSQCYTQKLRNIILSFEKNKQLEVFRLVCYSNSSRYIPESADLAEKLCAQFPKDWRLKYLNSQIINKNHANPLKVVELAGLYKEIIDLEPDAETLNNIAWDMAVEHGHFEIGGVNYLEIAKKSVEMIAEDYNLDTLGYIYYKLKEYDNAIKYLTRACEKTNSLAVAAHLAQAYYAAWDLPNFKKAVQKMLKLEPEEGMIHYNYAKALMDRFVNMLTKDEKLEVLDSAINGHNIYPCPAFQDLVREAYAFNLEHWNNEEFKKKYEPFIVKIIGDNKSEKDNLHIKIIWR